MIELTSLEQFMEELRYYTHDEILDEVDDLSFFVAEYKDYGIAIPWYKVAALSFSAWKKIKEDLNK